MLGLPVLYQLTIEKLNLGNSYFGIWIPCIAGDQASLLFLFRTFFGQQPRDIYECAKIDGANDLKLIFYILLPISFPIMLYAALGVFGGRYNDYIWSGLIMTSDNAKLLMPVLQPMALRLQQQSQQGAVYALYVLSGIPLIFTTIISIKYFQSGDFAAGLKMCKPVVSRSSGSAKPSLSQ